MSEELGVGSKLGSTSHGNLNFCYLLAGWPWQTEENCHRDSGGMKSKKTGEMDHAKEGNLPMTSFMQCWEGDSKPRTA